MSPQFFNILMATQPEPQLFGINMQTLVVAAIQLVIVVILFIVLKKLLHKPVSDFLKKREDRIAGDLQYADDEKAKANALKLEYEQKVKEIDREKAEVLDAARKQAEDRTKEAEAVARSEADAIRARAQKDIELEQERAKAEVKQAIIECSSTMVAKFLTRTIDAEMQEQLFNETMAELEDVAWHN